MNHHPLHTNCTNRSFTLLNTDTLHDQEKNTIFSSSQCQPLATLPLRAGIPTNTTRHQHHPTITLFIIALFPNIRSHLPIHTSQLPKNSFETQYYMLYPLNSLFRTPTRNSTFEERVHHWLFSIGDWPNPRTWRNFQCPDDR